MPSLISFISVAAGGAIGATARYGVSAYIGVGAKFPWPTLCVNVVGCFLAGVIGTWFLVRAPVSVNVQLLITTGILGGFTTFSAFSLETLRLAASGQWPMAGLNIAVNLIGSLVAVYCGWLLAKAILA